MILTENGIVIDGNIDKAALLGSSRVYLPFDRLNTVMNADKRVIFYDASSKTVIRQIKNNKELQQRMLIPITQYRRGRTLTTVNYTEDRTGKIQNSTECIENMCGRLLAYMVNIALLESREEINAISGHLSYYKDSVTYLYCITSMQDETGVIEARYLPNARYRIQGCYGGNTVGINVMTLVNMVNLLRKEGMLIEQIYGNDIQFSTNVDIRVVDGCITKRRLEIAHNAVVEMLRASGRPSGVVRTHINGSRRTEATTEI